MAIKLSRTCRPTRFATGSLGPHERPFTRWPAVFAVTAGIFAIVTTEIRPSGLLTPIAAGFGVSAGTAGWTSVLPSDHLRRGAGRRTRRSGERNA
ncbi:MFS transporter [Amycolatopsis vastitatis]|uniref:Major facilitator superfamily (MFS) profile domain-containing protein n=1 Tax=Amycolatopsis vastitatis TaxID=1905142 RepID=A0A229T4M9_9PSEU|nr:hypothetical protein CF165_22000 [Amycolatopsis vastitatis]